MTMAPYSQDDDLIRSCFKSLRLLRDALREESGLPLPHLSMGMSQDYRLAIEEGATWLRIGTTLFGERR